MVSKEHGHDTKIVHLKDQTAVTSATQTTDTLDTKDYESAMIAWDISVWAGAGSTWTPKLTESDSSSSGFTDVAAGDVEWIKNGAKVTGLPDANGPVVSDANTDQCCIVGVYLGGHHRYLRGVLTLAGSPTTMVAVPIGILGHPRETVGAIV